MWTFECVGHIGSNFQNIQIIIFPTILKILYKLVLRFYDAYFPSFLKIRKYNFIIIKVAVFRHGFWGILSQIYFFKYVLKIRVKNTC